MESTEVGTSARTTSTTRRGASSAPACGVSSARRFKDAVLEQFARIGKAVAIPKRLELLDIRLPLTEGT